MNLSAIQNETIQAMFFTPLHKIVSIIQSDDRSFITVKTDHIAWGFQVHKIKLDTFAAISRDPDDHSADSQYVCFSQDMRKLIYLAEQFGETLQFNSSFQLGRTAFLVNYLGEPPVECICDEFILGFNFAKERLAKIS